MTKKRVYTFGNGKAEGNAQMRELLGGKGANLAEMNLIGIPVPPGFTITTEVCTEYYTQGAEKTLDSLKEDVEKAIAATEKLMNMEFGSTTNPLLVSVRSGSRASMPGMMDTILNLGLNDEAVAGLAKKTGNERFAWDSYRRFIQMYGDVVMELKPSDKTEIDPFEKIIEEVKMENGVTLDSELSVENLKELVVRFKRMIKERTNQEFPTDPQRQLRGAIAAVFRSWMNERAILYRRMEGIPEEWGTAVTVQAMVFGNMGESSATGVCFTRNAATGENLFNGEYLVNAQGEDVVAGIRTPHEITLEGAKRRASLEGISEDERKKNGISLEELMPDIYSQLFDVQLKLQRHYRDMQDIEFTIQEGKLWILQTRNGKRTGKAMVKIAVDMQKEGLISEEELLTRIDPNKLDELLHPIFRADSLKKAKVIGKGLPASPGAATGKIVFFADDAAERHAKGEKVILVRLETSPEDLEGMTVSEAILTRRGGMTSHAAVVARGMGKCCVTGASELVIDYASKTLIAGGKTYHEGDFISVNGTTGEVYEGEIPTQPAQIDEDLRLILSLADKKSKLKVRANADTPADAQQALDLGAVGIGLCRTEHMFFEKDKITAMREMILAKDAEGRKKALAKILPFQRKDFYGIFKVMGELPVTVRLLDPPLHEFVPHDTKGQEQMAESMGLKREEIQARVEQLSEQNPMLGHRGCRLGNTFPEITRMQTRAILEACCQLAKEGVKTHPEIMIPLVGTPEEFIFQEREIRQVAEEVFQEFGTKVDYLVGTMIEIPRAALVAHKIASHAEFFSFGTNDLTQMTFGYSRDDIASFLPVYLDKKILKVDPFHTLDQEGVGELVRTGTERGRSTNPNLKVGICGEHGGEPSSVKFCHSVGMNYVSCSPFRVPLARVAAAQAVIE